MRGEMRQRHGGTALWCRNPKYLLPSGAACLAPHAPAPTPTPSPTHRHQQQEQRSPGAPPLASDPALELTRVAGAMRTFFARLSDPALLPELPKLQVGVGLGWAVRTACIACIACKASAAAGKGCVPTPNPLLYTATKGF